MILVSEKRIDALQRAAFEYFRDHTSPTTGLVRDKSEADSPCSIAAVGFGLSTYPVAVERGWIGRAEAAGIVRATLAFLGRIQPESACGHRGLFYHFLDMETGARAWDSELSGIDTAILMAGVLTVGAYFDTADETDIADKANSLFENVQWSYFENAGHAVRMGWKPGRGFLRPRWELYSEAQLLFILGMGSATHPLSAPAYAKWLDSCTTHIGIAGEYVYAGPLFIHLYPQAWVDLRGLNDALTGRLGIDYFESSRRAILEHREYARRNPREFEGYGENMWGLSACDGPKVRIRLRNGKRHGVGGYLARGAPNGPDDGTLAPWCIPSSLPFTPDEAKAALEHLLDAYPALLLDGRIPDAFNPSVPGDGPEGWFPKRQTGIDQGLIVLSIENYRTGLIWKLLRNSPVIKRGLRRGGFEGGWLGS